MYVPQSTQLPDVIAAIPQLSKLPLRPAFAGFWLRAVAYLFDTVLISLVFGLIASFYPSTFIKFPDAASTSLTSLPQLTPIAFAITITATWFYYTMFEASAWQATPGKRVLRLYVADLKGQRARRGAQSCENNFQFYDPGGLSRRRIHGEEASAARHSRQLPRLAQAVGKTSRRAIRSILGFGFLCGFAL